MALMVQTALFRNSVQGKAPDEVAQRKRLCTGTRLVTVDAWSTTPT